jgi:cell division protein FtsI (penicillin-binding protein 3)
VRINKENPEESRFMGIEGQYDYILRGKDGSQWMKRTDKGLIVDQDSAIVAVQHGQDIRTTINIDIQDIADRALRRYITDDERIEGGCVVVMDVKTGAIRAMVNLLKNSKDVLGENFNMAIGRPGEPGSIFKAATLATLLEDGHVTLETEIPTNHGKMEDLPKINDDQYIKDWERKHNTNTIKVLDGFKISSNYVFRRLVVDNYKDDPQDFVNRLYDYRLNDSYKFDLKEPGGTSSSIKQPRSKYDLASTAIGYSIMETPLNMLTFYNAIANNGKLMKPYLIESFETDGKVEKKFSPEVLNGSIVSKATADTLTRALKMVTLEGTATRLKNAKCQVAGKTGTAWTVLNPDEKPLPQRPFESINGEKKYQATFVGFFPADEPKYSAIVVVYTKLTKGSVYGGVIPAMTFKEIVDNLWSLDSTWGEQFQARAKVPEMKPEYIATRQGSSIPVPDVKGMGLMDAVYAIENNGYKCIYEGIGHVVSQSPAAGKICTKGETIKLVLK